MAATNRYTVLSRHLRKGISNANQSLEGTSESVDRHHEIDIVDSDNAIYKRSQKTTNREEKRSPFRGQMNRNQSSDIRKNYSKSRFRLLRLSQRKFSGRERMMGGTIFNDSLDNFVWGHMSESSSDGSKNNTVVCGKCKNSGEINEDWGRRTKLHNIFNVNDGDKVWNFVNRGLFADIKLWKNEYGSLCCKARGKISVKGASERSIIEIDTENNLRKLLNLSHVQWSALCEALSEMNTALSFNAFEDVDINKKSSLEKLWLFICKRRHFLPNICVLGKLSGAVRIMKELSIMPKIVVTEIRDFKGEEII